MVAPMSAIHGYSRAMSDSDENVGAAEITSDSPATRYFDRREVREAMTYALSGGIAVHRNFDVDGITIGGKVRKGAAFHVLGSRASLLAWGLGRGLSARWLQPPTARRQGVWHFDVFGAGAIRLEREWRNAKLVDEAVPIAPSAPSSQMSLLNAWTDSGQG